MNKGGLFRKASKKVTVNEQEINVRPLGMGVILSLHNLKGDVATAIAKFKTINISDYKESSQSTPKPTETDPDNIELIRQTSHSAPSEAAVAQAIDNKAKAIEALFDCLFKEDLLAKILSSSVEELKGLTHEELFSDDGDKSLDLATAIEIFTHIIEINIGGFESLGKSCNPLKKFLKSVGVSL